MSDIRTLLSKIRDIPLPFGIGKTARLRRYWLSFFRQASADDIQLHMLSVLLELTCETREFDDLAVAATALHLHGAKIVLSTEQFERPRAIRPDLVERILHAHLARHGHREVRAAALGGSNSPMTMAIYRLLLGQEAIDQKKYRHLVTIGHFKLMQHFAGPMTAHEWMEMKLALGGIEELLRDPFRLDDYLTRIHQRDLP